MIARQTASMSRMVNELFDLSRIRRNQVQLQPEPLELSELARRTADAARPILEERGQNLRVVTPTEPIPFEADPGRLEQVLTNLLNNAARYSEPGGTVTLTAATVDGHVTFAVRDQGIGLRPEMLSRIWEPFTQADRVPGRAVEGLGLGLAVVRQLTELHGGSVAAHSEGPGLGSTFEVKIPRQSPTRLPIKKKPSTATVRPMRVLICDDSVDAAISTAELLRLAGAHGRGRPRRPVGVALGGGLRPGSDPPRHRLAGRRRRLRRGPATAFPKRRRSPLAGGNHRLRHRCRPATGPRGGLRSLLYQADRVG